MGNVVDLPAESDSSIVEQKDREYLELPCTSVFNDEYVASVFSNLPNLDGIDFDALKKAKGSTPKPADPQILRLVDIMSRDQLTPDSLSIDGNQVFSSHENFLLCHLSRPCFLSFFLHSVYP